MHLLVSIGYLGGVLSGIPGGVLGDRLGVKRAILLVGTLAGCASLLRAFFPSYHALAFLTFLVGATDGMIFPNLPKIVRDWFPPEEHGVATGISVSGVGLGAALPLAVGAHFPTWQSGFLATGGLVLALVVVWFLVFKEPAQHARTGLESIPLGKGISQILKNKTILLLCVADFLFLASLHSVIGSLPAALITERGAAEKVAGFATALIIISTVPGNVFWPALSDRIGRVKPVLGLAAVGMGICTCSAWGALMATGGWILLAAMGFCAGAMLPLFLSFPPRLPGINPEQVATASGVILTAGRLGGFVVLPFLFSPIALNYSYSWGYVVVGTLAALIALVTLAMKEVGKHETLRKPASR